MSGGKTPAAIYLRLSAADGDKAESGSIANQRAFLHQWAEREGFEITAEYADDGYTGTDFERPGFRALMQALKAGEVGCFATVDLSRLGRNYLEVGLLQEQTFPAMGVRYIAVNDGYDSSRTPAEGLDPAVFKNLMNDLYARDASRKALRAKRTLQRQGKYLGGRPPYGYRLAPGDRYRLEPDEETGLVAARIYRDFLAGESCGAIARALQGEGVPTPGRRPGGQWGSGAVRRILSHPVYRGAVAQHTREMVSYRVHKARAVPPGEWIVVEDAHPPLVSREEWEQAARLLANRRHRPARRREHPFAGLAFCADCGSPLYARRAGGHDYLVCSRYSRAPGQHLCTGHYFREDLLLEMVADALARLCAGRPGLLRALAGEISRGSQSGRAKKEKEQAARALEKLGRARLAACKSAAEGAMTGEELGQVLQGLREEESALKKRLEATEQKGTETPEERAERWLRFESLDRFCLQQLVRKICIDREKRVTIRFAFAAPEGADREQLCEKRRFELEMKKK